jgi:hypothetical protein
MAIMMASRDDDDDSADGSDDSEGSSEDFPAFSALERGTLLQCASYALEVLSHEGWCRYVLGALVISDRIRPRSFFLRY